MTVVAIIAILMVAGAVASFTVFDAAAEQQTRLTLAALKSIAEAYEAQTNQTIVNAPANTAQIQDFVAMARQIPTTDQMLGRLGEDVYDPRAAPAATNFNIVFDGWGRPLRYRQANTGTVSTLPDYPHPFFASAGSNGVWGTNDDDLYSFDLE